MFTDATCNPEMMKNATDAYLSLLQGTVDDVGCNTDFYTLFQETILDQWFYVFQLTVSHTVNCKIHK